MLFGLYSLTCPAPASQPANQRALGSPACYAQKINVKYLTALYFHDPSKLSPASGVLSYMSLTHGTGSVHHDMQGWPTVLGHVE